MLLAGMLFLVDSSCAKMIPIPEADYRKTDPRRDETYRLTTKEDRVYSFNRFTVTDSALVILEMKTYDQPSFLGAPRDQEPVVVPWKDVKSLERFGLHNKLTKLMIVAGVAGVLYVAFWVVVGIGLSEGKMD
jgi:hypothetical protein